jgi:hypothetical protein
MNYKSIIAKAIEENITQKTPISTYFIREANKNKEIEHEEFDDFFDGCKYIISLYKKEIERQFNNLLNEDNFAENSYKQMLKNGINFDAGGNSIQESLKRIEEDREIILKEGYKDNTHYLCCIRSDHGDMVENSFTGCLIPLEEDNRTLKYDILKLTFSDIEGIEKSLIECRAEILKESKFKDLTEKPKEHFTDYLINITDKDSFIIKIAPLINNQEAKQIAYLLIYLDIEKYILFPKKRTEIYKIMRSDFSIIPTNKSINDYLGKYFSAKEKSLITENVVISLFEEFYLKITELDNIKSLMK